MSKDSNKAMWDLLNKQRDTIPLLAHGSQDAMSPLSTFPTTEHTSLLTNRGEVVVSPLTLTLFARTAKVPEGTTTAQKEKDLETKKHSNSITFKGTPMNPIPKIDFESMQKQLEPMVIQHVKMALATNKSTSRAIASLLTPSAGFIGEFSSTPEQRLENKIKTYCVELLADDPYAPSSTEDANISRFVLTELDMPAVPRASTHNDDKRRYDLLLHSYKIGLLALRDMINHTYLRAIHECSSSPSRKHLRQVHHDFLQEQTRLGTAVLFTAKNIIKFISDKCTTTNESSIKASLRKLEIYIRNTNQKPHKFLKAFEPLTKRLVKAQGSALSTAQDKAWKDHFVHQLTMREREVINNHKDTMVVDDAGAPDPALVNQMKTFMSGVFDTPIMLKLLQDLDSTFTHFQPDITVRTYVIAYATSNEWENTTPDFRPPSERARNSKRKREDSKTSSSPRDSARKTKGSSSRGLKKNSFLNSATVIPKADQCKWPECVRRKNNTNHTHRDCNRKHSKPSSSSQPHRSSHKDKRHHPNLGKAQQKGGMRKQPTKANHSHDCWHCKEKGCDKHKCFLCGKNHPKRDCPQLGQVETRLKKSKTFFTMMTEVFPERLQTTANKMVRSYGEHACRKCFGFSCSNTSCRTKDPKQRKKVKEVKQLLADNQRVLHALQEAHQLEIPNITTINSSFLAGDGGHEDLSEEDTGPSESEINYFNKNITSEDDDSLLDEEDNNECHLMAGKHNASDSSDAENSGNQYHQSDDNASEYSQEASDNESRHDDYDSEDYVNSQSD